MRPSRFKRGPKCRGTDVERTRAGRPVEGLVAGEREQVDRCGPQVDRHDARRLRGVDQEEGARLADDSGDLGDRLDQFQA